MMINQHKFLYKLDTKNKVRVWYAEREGSNYRIISGLLDGKLVTSEWKTSSPKNIGKINETTAEGQALAEVIALYEKQEAQGGYVDDIDNIHEETYFEPMLAEKYADKIKHIESAFNRGEKVYISPKLDGFRNCQNKIGMWSRNGKPYISSPHISYALIDLFIKHPDIILDGELYNHDLHDNFNKLQSLITKKKPTSEDLQETKEKVQYHVYDIFLKNNPNANFEQRFEILKNISDEFFDNKEIVLVEQIPCSSFEDIDNSYSSILEKNYEGLIVRLNTQYENKRTNNLLKRKEFFDAEYTIVDILSGVGNWNRCAKSLLFSLPDGTPFSAGIRGSMEEMERLLSNKEKYIGCEATIRYPNLTPDGIPRFPVVTNIWPEGKRSV